MPEAKNAAEAVENADQIETQEQFAAADAAADPAPPPSIEDIASELGWVPQDKFNGPTEKWKPAEQFIRDGKKIQEAQSRELRGIRETLDTIKLTNASIMEERLKEQHAQLSQRYAAAVEKGDPDEAFKAATEIRDLQTRAATPQRSGPDPETEAWVSKNQRVKADPLAWQRALQVCDAYARAGQPIEAQLASTEAVLKREFPHLFDDKAAPQVNGNITRSTASAPKGKTAADMPKEARDVAKDMVERGLIPNEDAYARNYFAAVAKKG